MLDVRLLCQILTALAIAISPIAWVPGFGNVVAMKYVVIGACLVIAILFRKEVSFDSTTVQLVAVASVFAVLAELGRQTSHAIEERMLSTIRASLIAWLMIVYPKRLVGDQRELIRIGVFSALITSVAIVVGFVLRFVGFEDASRFMSEESFLALSRTGWSGPVACIAIFHFSLALSRDLCRSQRTVCWVASFLAISSQVYVAGRAGLVASTLGILLSLPFASKRVGLLIVFGLGAIVVANFDSAKSVLRIERPEKMSRQTLDDFSAGRLSEAKRVFSKSSFWLLGAEGQTYESVVSGKRPAIHNVFVNSMFKFGVLHAILIALVTARLFWSSLTIFDRNVRLLFAPAVVGALPVMLLEPNAVWFSPTSYFAWWLLAGLSLRINTSGRSDPLVS